MSKEIEVPKWFEGEVYENGDNVTNRFSDSLYDLN